MVTRRGLAMLFFGCSMMILPASTTHEHGGLASLLDCAEAEDKQHFHLRGHVQADGSDHMVSPCSSVARQIPPHSSPPDSLGNDVGRPAWVVYPDTYDPEGNKTWPLIMLLHGYGSDEYYHDHFLGVSSRVSSHGFVALLPNGTTNSQGRHFWNGLRCCDFDNQHPNDVGYLTGLIAEATETLKVDPKRVYIIAHSNGGAMSQILACEHAELFAAVASVTPGEIPDVCTPSHPVSVLEVCASQDPIVKIDLCSHIIDSWKNNDGCPATSTFTDNRDYDCDPSRPWDDNTDGHGFVFNEWHGHNCRLEGAETEVTGYSCAKNTAVEFWWMKGAQHNPAFSAKWSDDVISWLLSKPYVEAA